MKRALIITFVIAASIVACGGKKNTAKTSGDGSAMGSDMSGHDMGSNGSGSGSAMGSDMSDHDMGSAHHH